MKGFAILIPLVLSSCTLLAPPKEPEGPTYDPATYGTGALIGLLLDPERIEPDALLAAETLADRRMGKEDGLALMLAVRTQSYENVRLEVLNTIGTHQLSYLYSDLMAYVEEAEQPQTAVRALDAASAVQRRDRPLFQDLSRLLLQAEKPEVRVRAGILLTKRFPYEAEPVLIEALKDEESATVAAMITEYLSQTGTRRSLPILEQVSNDIGRVFVEDAFLGKPFTAESVRGGAVQGVQRLREDLSQ